MPDITDLDGILAGAAIDDEVFALCPDYRVVLLAVDGLSPGPGNQDTEALLLRAEAQARAALAVGPVEEQPHIAAWRDAYRSFGAKPQRTRNSAEALLRRAATGLPRVNRLTDLYNAVSVLYQIPLGGEDLSAYAGPPRLVRAAGDEKFDTTAGGDPVTEHPEPGEVIWRDDTGVTCRRWNWRQGLRTQLTDRTTQALFIFDALEPVAPETLSDSVVLMREHLVTLGPDVRIAQRLIDQSPTVERA
ncbi:hypothetical protein HQO82_12530 [Rhodococcus fascians]|nr:hypothetical protein [Rhodococcus fascians]MBY4114650.1 hypothetical protein [Rhodococcus fascians]